MAKDLYNAIREGNLQKTNTLIDSCGLSASSGLLGGYSPLKMAVDMNRVDIAKLLLDKGYTVNASEAFPYSPLHFAVGNGSCEMVELLLEKGADVNSRAKKKNGLTPLFLAIKQRRLPIVELLLKYGADVNAEDKDGTTALHFCFYFVYTSKPEAVLFEIVKLLLNKGANVNAQTRNGLTPLHLSIRRGLYSFVDLLLRYSYDADLNLPVPNLCGTTALHFAAEDGARRIASSLLAKGADVNAQSSDGKTALHVAVERNHEEVVELFLENGAIVNCVDGQGYSPFHYLAKSERQNFKEMGTLLLKRGADVNRKTQFGTTALHFAATQGKAEFVEFLLDNGAIINTKCNRGLTPLEISTANTGDVLLRHQAQMEGLGLYVEESDISDRYEGRLEELKKSCQEEVLLLRSEFIEGTSVSYFDFVRKDGRFLARYMNNENMVQAAELEEYRSKFPTYASMIKSQFRRGRARNQLIKAANQVLNQLIDLPDYCTDKIMDYLCDDDLAVLIGL